MLNGCRVQGALEAAFDVSHLVYRVHWPTSQSSESFFFSTKMNGSACEEGLYLSTPHFSVLSMNVDFFFIFSVKKNLWRAFELFVLTTFEIFLREITKRG